MQVILEAFFSTIKNKSLKFKKNNQKKERFCVVFTTFVTYKKRDLL